MISCQAKVSKLSPATPALFIMTVDGFGGLDRFFCFPNKQISGFQKLTKITGRFLLQFFLLRHELSPEQNGGLFQ